MFLLCLYADPHCLFLEKCLFLLLSLGGCLLLLQLSSCRPTGLDSLKIPLPGSNLLPELGPLFFCDKIVFKGKAYQLLEQIVVSGSDVAGAPKDVDGGIKSGIDD